MKAVFLITEFNNVITGFLFEDNRLTEIYPFNEESILGNIYAGRITNIVKNINAAFVEVEKGLSCYYSLNDNEGHNIFLNNKKNDKPVVGDELLVQVTREPVKSKKYEVSAALSLRGRYTVVNTTGKIGISSKIHDNKRKSELKDLYVEFFEENREYSGFGVIGRTESEKAGNEDIIKETITLLCKLKEIMRTAKYTECPKLLYSESKNYLSEISHITGYSKYENFSIITDIDDIHETLISENSDKDAPYDIKLHDDTLISLKSLYSVESEVEKALKKKVYLKSGAYLVIEPAEALISIDVNTGKAVKGSIQEEHLLKINLEAAKEAARQIRLRNLSGIIIIDFINMKDENNLKVLKDTMESYLARDSAKAYFVDFTALGLMEITRKKIRKPLYELFK